MNRLCIMVALGVLLAGCKKDPCPENSRGLTDAMKTEGGSCWCPEGIPSGTVWGEGPYATDSNLCLAAIHAGAIDAKGGNITFKPMGGCPSYGVSSKNGVTTVTWPAADSSFYFPGRGEPVCKGAIPDQCPPTFLAILNSATVTTFSCTCPPVAAGLLYGNGIYTRDSSLCRAAVHAGAIPATGGKITVRPASGCTKYEGVEKNGIKSSRWGAYNLSYYFEGFGTGACAGAQ